MSVDILTNTRASQWHLARNTNQTSASFVSRLPKAAEPVGDADTATGASIIDLTHVAEGSPQTGPSQNGVCACFFGAGSNTNTFSARIIGWSAIGTDRKNSVTPDNRLWVPIVLAELLCTIKSAIPGVANTVLGTTQLFADTIAVVGTAANQGVGIDIVSAGNSTIAHVFCDLRGSQKLEFSFSTGSSATSCNALYKLF